MKDWKTTVTAIVGAVAVLGARYGLNLSDEVQGAIVTITVVLIGLFAGDSKKPEEPPKQ